MLGIFKGVKQEDASEEDGQPIQDRLRGVQKTFHQTSIF